MLVPKQAEPVRVADGRVGIPSQDRAVVPQVYCVCKLQSGVPNPKMTWHCVIGRDLWDTGQVCSG
jgi:hypothetical protein